MPRLTERERRKLIAKDSPFSWEQVGFRDGHRGDVHDTYVLKFRKEDILIIRHYVEFSLEEVPLVVTVTNSERFNIVT